ncbi:B-cell lymphoma 3 protein homolog [Gadus macrocephalus]|uniref:B-cell lymphoma 3 protein homolog n=1 Tax=Gadus macrocephalus TaxID=80720 RepID=UPI0028CBAD95|nr:B-cell lymphoma 3 protein homolog [Gadus macrocephalus]
MPRLIIMNNSYRSVVPGTPLDLRTRSRDEMSRGSRPPMSDCDRRTTGGDRVRAETDTSGSAGRSLPRRRGVEQHRADALTISTAQLDTGLGHLLSTPRTPTNSESRTSLSTFDRRTPDQIPSRLPLRKRPFPSEAETLAQSTVLPDTRDQFLTENTDTTPRQSPAESLRVFESRVRRASSEAAPAAAAAPKYTRLEPPAAPFPDVFYGGHAHTYYGPTFPRNSDSFLYTSLPRFPPLPHPLVSNVAMAMHQDEDGDTPLHIAVAQGEEAVVHKLIFIMKAARKNLNIYNRLRQTPLHLAVITQHEGLVEGLLRAGADPASLDRHGRTALHLCCEYGRADCLSAVLSHPSSLSCVDATTFEGLSPLHIAVQGGHQDLLRMLLDAGADINIKDIKSGQSPLMYAVERNNVDIVQFLIESGSDVNGQSNSGNTALHGACGRGQVDTVWLLLKKGADPGIKNNHNDTPVMVAKNKKIADVLRGKSSKLSRSQDQPLAVPSSHSSSLLASGSLSPHQSPTFHL